MLVKWWIGLKVTAHVYEQSHTNEPLLGKFVWFVLHQSLRIHSKHQDETHIERLQAYPDCVVENCEWGKKGIVCEKQIYKGSRTFVSPHRLKRPSSQAVRSHQAHRGSKGQSRRRRRSNTHGFMHKCQPPACQGITVARTDRSGMTQCQAEKTGNVEQSNAWARQKAQRWQRRRIKRPWYHQPRG